MMLCLLSRSRLGTVPGWWTTSARKGYLGWRAMTTMLYYNRLCLHASAASFTLVSIMQSSRWATFFKSCVQRPSAPTRFRSFRLTPRLSYWTSGGYRAGLMGGQAGGPIHYIWYESNILEIFSKYSLKIPQIYSNMLKYTQICSNILKYAQIYSNIFLSGRREGLSGVKGRRAVRAGRRASKQLWLPPMRQFAFLRCIFPSVSLTSWFI
jgi:hypothetical protein